MRTLVLVAVTTATFAFGLASCRVDSTNVVPLEHPNYHAPALVAPHQPGKTMRGFQSEQELAKYLHELVEKQKRNRDGKFGYELSGGAVLEKSESLSVPADKQSSANEDSVTNVQE